ncbi:hypothetical protein GOV10_03820 [Candidatus Woesearchaeota archaeon]|nr:hypothetical protein [Candidatus Woesearchaeota archaeon]
MTLELIIEPRVSMSWTDFKDQKGPYSIALDGYVTHRTMRDRKGPYANFDHHMRCDRFSTIATCGQVYNEVRNHMMEDSFQKDGQPHAHIYVNDPDEDTELASFILLNHEDPKIIHSPFLKDLVLYEEEADRMGGAILDINPELQRAVESIFGPYNNARFKEDFLDMDSDDMRVVFDATHKRIYDYLTGKEPTGEYTIPEELRKFDILHQGTDWILTQEYSQMSRIKMFREGHKRFIALLGESNSRYRYSIGRKSEWVDFDLKTLYKMLNKVEAELVYHGNLWGGSNTIGGSPRFTGSHLPPEELFRIIEEWTNKHPL